MGAICGKLAKAAHDDGLVVLARMDSNRAAEDFYKQHPDWFARDAKGAPYRAADKYVTCVKSPYEHCSKCFHARTGKAIPKQRNWDDNYARRVAIWDLHNRTAQAAGGPDCLWIGMNSGSVTNRSRQFRDNKEICKRAEILFSITSRGRRRGCSRMGTRAS